MDAVDPYEPSSPSFAFPSPTPPYAPYPPMPEIHASLLSDPSCSLAASTSNFPCEYGVRVVSGYPRYLTNKRYVDDQYASEAALEKYHPRFRYEFSLPVRLCSSNQYEIAAGFSSCVDEGISSWDDFYDQGYTDSIVWSGAWYMATQRDPVDREIDYAGKIPCTSWCSSGGALGRCVWYARFVERYGNQGQFDYSTAAANVDGEDRGFVLVKRIGNADLATMCAV